MQRAALLMGRGLKLGMSEVGDGVVDGWGLFPARRQRLVAIWRVPGSW